MAIAQMLNGNIYLAHFGFFEGFGAMMQASKSRRNAWLGK
jgi:hypothetical protein